nr:hypothetical protein [Clostridia bacterium]
MSFRDVWKSLVIAAFLAGAALLCACMGYARTPGEASPSPSAYVEVTRAAGGGLAEVRNLA